MNNDQKVKSIVLLGGIFVAGVLCGNTDTFIDGALLSIIIGFSASKLIEWVNKEGKF